MRTCIAVRGLDSNATRRPNVALTTTLGRIGERMRVYQAESRAGTTTANTRLVITCRPPAAALPRVGLGGPSFLRGLGFSGRLARSLRGRNLLSFLLNVVLESIAFVLMFLLAACRLWSSKRSLGSVGRASEVFRRWADEAKVDLG